jgi:hypothetical protein
MEWNQSTPPQAKRGKRANNSTLLFLAVRGKPKKRESWFAFLLFLPFFLFSSLFCGVMGGAARQCSANKREQREKKDKSIEFNIISVFS